MVEADTEREEMYAESVRRYHEAIRCRNRALWFAYFCSQADAHRKLSESYERRAEDLCAEENKWGSSADASLPRN